MPPSSTSLPEDSGFSYSPGDVIAGKYALEEQLGAGGMGAVFRARNTTIDMPVAIKLIRSDLDRDTLSGRLLQEARAAAKLAHPAIVRVFDVGKTALGDPFIVMELLQGESLATVLDRDHRLSSARAVQLLLPIADALSVAHAKGLIHRDVKPDNVFIAIDEEGQLQPKLVDFGIVKAELPGQSQLTQVGAVIGSPDYMSPEQARGLERIDLRSDVWSFAVVLYETIFGETPFRSDNYNALLRLIVETEAPTLLERRVADAELSAIVERGMSKHPDERFASMGQMGRALATWLHERGITEDACGVSIEARWLSRPSDPTYPGRVTRSSSPDSWPEPPSGVRAVSGGIPGRQLGHATTVEASKSAGTPVALVGTLSQAPSPRERRAYLLAAAAVALATVTLAWFALRPPPTNEPPARASASGPVDARAETTPQSPVAPRPQEPAAVPAPPAAPAPQAIEQTPAPAAVPAPMTAKDAKLRSNAAAKAVPAKPATAPAKEPAPAAAKPAPKPASDLLSPY
ncbi:MAG TPA: serine/threonine-protein kinase [Polyangiaceae bacterium]|nr:serine/threonine-protein kinase [Polyangiaceae bacterium]